MTSSEMKRLFAHFYYLKFEFVIRASNIDFTRGRSPDLNSLPHGVSPLIYFYCFLMDQVFATLATFYLPLIIILFLYWRIFQTAQKRIRRKQASNMRTASLMERRMSTSAPPISIVSGTTVLSVATRTDQQVVPVVRLVVGEVSLSENVSSGSNLFRRSATIKRRKVCTTCPWSHYLSLDWWIGYPLPLCTLRTESQVSPKSFAKITVVPRG